MKYGILLVRNTYWKWQGGDIHGHNINIPLLRMCMYIYANPWISEVSIVGWGVPFVKGLCLIAEEMEQGVIIKMQSKFLKLFSAGASFTMLN